ALIRRHIGGEAHRLDRLARLFGTVEAELSRSTRQRREQRHSLDDASDELDVAIELARRLTDDGIELAAVAAVYIVVPAGAHHPIAVDEPLAADLRVAGGRELSCEAGLRCIRVGVRQSGERNIFRGDDEFCRQRLLGGPERARVVGIAPLHDKIILHALYRETVEIVLAYELFDVG